MATTRAYALPTEPLLDEPTQRWAKAKVPASVAPWLKDLAHEGELPSRATALFHSMRKKAGEPMLLDMGRGILASAVRGQTEGVGVLAAFLSVSAPGQILIERVREFSNLHRQVELSRRSQEAGETLPPAESKLLEQLARVDAELAPLFDDAIERAREGGVARDRGPARVCRRVFGALVAELEATGTLETNHLEHLLAVARLELDAMELRASTLAGAINPYSARHVSKSMPILASLDGDLRDMRAFLGQLEETKRPSIFHNQRTALSDLLEPRDVEAIRKRLEQESELQILWRLLRGLERNPLPGRTLAWFVDRFMDMGDHLHERGLRRAPMDVVTAALHVLDFHDDGILSLPASPPVLEALGEVPIEGIELGEGSVRVVFDPSAARRLLLPMGLPVPVRDTDDVESEEKAEEETVKDLVLSNLNNTSVLLGLLKNQKVVNTPGVVALVAQRCRNMRVLDVICTTRNLHSGFANKDVPMALLKSPMNIPVKTLRKFVSVRFVSKIDLRRMATDRSSIRRDVANEIETYLKSLA